VARRRLHLVSRLFLETTKLLTPLRVFPESGLFLRRRAIRTAKEEE
jgi:hypothetical protein